MMSRAEAEGSQAEAAEPPAKLFLKSQTSTSSCLDTVFDEIAKEQPEVAQWLAAGASIELDTYLGEAPSPREDSPLKYWVSTKSGSPLWLKWPINTSQPHVAVWKVKGFSAQCHTL